MDRALEYLKMLNGELPSVLRDKLHRLPRPLRTLVYFAMGLLSLYFSLSQLIPIRWVAWVVAAVGSATALYVLRSTVPVRGELPTREGEFHPIGSRDGAFLKRTEIIRALARELESCDGAHVHLVVGQSGTGKSTIVRDLLPASLSDLESDWAIGSPIDGYLAFKTFASRTRDVITELGGSVVGAPSELASEWVFPHLQGRSLLVFDQFEEFLHLAKTDQQATEWFMRFLKSYSESGANACLVIVIREDFYFGLREMLKHAGIEYSESSIKALSERRPSDRDDLDDAHVLLRKVIRNNDLADQILDDLSGTDSILPLEIQMLGFVIEDMQRASGKRTITRDQYKRLLGGRMGLVRQYFLRYIEATRHRDAASAVLYALSYAEKGRFQSCEQIHLATHRDTAVIEKVLETLKEGGLVVELDAHYRIAHDYLAKSYEELSSSLLDLADRDNIKSFSELLNRGTKQELSSRIFPVPASNQFATQIAVPYLLALAAILVRLIFPSLGFQAAERAILGQQAVVAVRFFDWRYLPAFIASTACLLYTWQLFSNLLFTLPTRRWFSTVSLFMTITCILAGTVLVHAWLALAAIAGILLAARIIAISREFRAHRFFVAGNLLTATASRYPINMIAAAAIGLGIFVLRYSPSLGIRAMETVNETLGFPIELLFALLIALFMTSSWKNHARKGRASILIGIWDRVRLLQG